MCHAAAWAELRESAETGTRAVQHPRTQLPVGFLDRKSIRIVCGHRNIDYTGLYTETSRVNWALSSQWVAPRMARLLSLYAGLPAGQTRRQSGGGG